MLLTKLNFFDHFWSMNKSIIVDKSSVMDSVLDEKIRLQDLKLNVKSISAEFKMAKN